MTPVVAPRIAHTLMAHHDRSNPTDSTYVLGPLAFHASQDPISSRISSPSLGRKDTMGVLTFDEVQITHPENRTRPTPDSPTPDSPTPTLARTSARVTAISETMRPRRLTPREWERLQGFPDDYTAITVGKAIAKDTPRYQAIGNSMAVPVMRWIGNRIAMVDPIVDFG